MKRVEVISSAEEWAGVSESGEILFAGNPNSGLRFHIGNPRRALYYNSHIPVCANKRACAEMCREWNKGLGKNMASMKVKPMRVRFLVSVTKEVKNTKSAKNNTKGRSMK